MTYGGNLTGGVTNWITASQTCQPIQRFDFLCLASIAILAWRDADDGDDPYCRSGSPAHPAFAERAGSRDAMTEITDVHTDRLLPCQGSRTSRRRSHRSRKQNQPRFRRLRSERYPCQ
jgi:hypothetical protein